MAKQNKNPFAGKGQGDVQGTYEYIDGDGEYLARVENAKIGRNRKKAELAFMEVTIVKVLSEASNHRVGQTVSRAVHVTHDYFMSEVVNFLKGVIGPEVGELDDEELQELCSEMFPHVDEGKDSPLKGSIVELNAWQTKTQEGKDFTKIAWRTGPPANQIVDVLGEQTADRFFPPEEREAMIKAEAES